MALVLGTVTEIAGFVGVNRATINRWVKDGQLETYRIRGRARVALEDVQDLMKQQTRGRPHGAKTRTG